MAAVLVTPEDMEEVTFSNAAFVGTMGSSTVGDAWTSEASSA